MSIKFDQYDLKARLTPVLLAVMPLCAVCAYLPSLSAFLTAIPVLFVMGAGLFAEHVCRYFGKRKEADLVKRWNGYPTVRALRIPVGGIDPLLKARRRDVERLGGLSLPSRKEQDRNPVQADAQYDAAVRRCLPKIDRKAHPLHFKENVSYGFRRNLLALKPIGLITLGITGALVAALSYSADEMFSAVTITIGGLLLVAALAWIGIVREPWVRAQADTFSDRFFISIAP